MMVIEIFIARNQRKHSLTQHVKTVLDFSGLSNIKRIQQFTGVTGQTELAIKFFYKKRIAIEIEFYFSALRSLKVTTWNTTFCYRQTLTL